MELIKRWGRRDLGTGCLLNLTDGGEGASNFSEITRKKISEKGKGRIQSEETKKKRADSCRGKKRSDESKKKMSNARKNYIPSDDTKRKISESTKGKRGYPPWNKGIKMSEDFCQKISCSNKGKNKGKIAWNKGLTKGTDERVAKYAKSLSRRCK